MNEGNLIPISERSSEEIREMGRKGGIASGEARRRKRSMIDAIDLLLSQPCNLKGKGKNSKSIKDLAKQLGIKEEDMDNQMAIVISMFNVAMGGGKNSVNAATFLRDTGGDKPKDQVEVSGTGKKFAEICEQLGDDGLDE